MSTITTADTFKTERPLGLSRNDLNFSLENHENIFAVCAKKLAPQIAIWRQVLRLNTDLSDEQILREHAHELHYSNLAPFLSFSEMAQLHHELEFVAQLRLDIMDEPLHFFLLKMSLSAWNGTAKRLPWQHLISLHKVITDFDFGVEGFEVNFDHTFHCSESSYGVYTRVFIDSELALIISQKGKHVLTIGVGVDENGLRVNQIQMAEERGNRWAYKLPAPYFEHTLCQLFKTCEDNGVSLFLGTGESVKDWNKSAYSKMQQDEWEAMHGEHVIRQYDQPLQSLVRSAELYRFNALEYRQLKAR